MRNPLSCDYWLFLRVTTLCFLIFLSVTPRAMGFDLNHLVDVRPKGPVFSSTTKIESMSADGKLVLEGKANIEKHADGEYYISIELSNRGDVWFMTGGPVGEEFSELKISLIRFNGELVNPTKPFHIPRKNPFISYRTSILESGHTAKWNYPMARNFQLQKGDYKVSVAIAGCPVTVNLGTLDLQVE